MKYITAMALGAFIFVCVLGFIAGGEDRAVAEKCDYAGKVKLGGQVYECRRAAPSPGDSE